MTDVECVYAEGLAMGAEGAIQSFAKAEETLDTMFA